MVTQCSWAATTRKNRDIYLLRFIATTSGDQWIKGCLKNSDLEASDLRPQTSKLQTPWKTKNDWNYMNELFIYDNYCDFVTPSVKSHNNPALQTGKRFPTFLFKTKTTTTITMEKLFHFRVFCLKKRPDLPGQCIDSMSYIFYTQNTCNTLSINFSMNPSEISIFDL